MQGHATDCPRMLKAAADQRYTFVMAPSHAHRLVWLTLLVLPLKAGALECDGQPPLYAFPEEGGQGALFPLPTPAAVPRDDMVGPRAAVWPVAFVSSGNACLGPIPVFRLTEGLPVVPTRTTHDMARQLAPILHHYSARTGLEGCARMCQTPGGLVVAQLVTLHSHVSCQAPTQSCPAGSQPLSETIHSHPPHRVFLANEVDALGWDEPGIVGTWVWTGYPNAVSDPDRRQAPVWVVGTQGQLIWLATPDGQEVERP